MFILVIISYQCKNMSSDQFNFNKSYQIYKKRVRVCHMTNVRTILQATIQRQSKDTNACVEFYHWLMNELFFSSSLPYFMSHSSHSLSPNLIVFILFLHTPIPMLNTVKSSQVKPDVTLD